MKNIAIWLIAILCLMASCSDMLDEEPTSSVTGNIHYKTYSGLSDALSGAYNGLRSVYGQQSGFMMSTPGTDIFTHGSEGGQDFDSYDARLNPQMGRLLEIWNSLYASINSCNAVIDRADLLEDATEEQKNELKAEALYLRALYYYWLTQHWGDVPFRVYETTEITTEANRDSEQSILNQLVLDLNTAVDQLPLQSSQEKGRASKGAAQHLLAKIHLVIGFKYDPASYALAEQISNQVLNSGEYELVPYGEIFAYSNQNNKEVIFTAEFSTDPVFNGNGNQGHLFFTPPYDKFPGLTRDLNQGGRPWTRFAPTAFYRTMFDANDARYDVTFRYTWIYNNASSLPVGKSLGDTVDWNYADGTVSKIAPNEGLMHWGIKKHDDPTRASFQDTRGFRDFFIFRYAETFLVYAEALVQQGKNEQAALAINQLREMRAKPGTVLPQISASDMSLDLVLDERARELGGEMHRWMDLARTGKLVERIKKYNVNAAVFIKDYHVYRPIPQDEIDLVKNENFKQNDGY